MQMKYRYYYGGDWNPYAKDAEKAYLRLTEERKLADPKNERPLEALFPQLPSWAEYVVAESKSTFWQMERAVGLHAEEKSCVIEGVWAEANAGKNVDAWILDSAGDESEKALCYYMKVQYGMFSPGDGTVDFRLYFSEGGQGERIDTDGGFTLEAYED